MEKILILDRIEDIVDKGNVIGKHLFDSAGNDVKIKKGQGGRLEAKWGELQIGRAYSFTMGDYKGFPYVEDFKSVKNKFVEQAQKQVTDNSIAERRRGFALSYAKDIAVAKIRVGKETSATEVITIATLFESYLENGAIVTKKKPTEPIDESKIPY